MCIKTYRLAEITVDLTAENVELGKCQHRRRKRVRIDTYIVSRGTVWTKSAEEEKEKRGDARRVYNLHVAVLVLALDFLRRWEVVRVVVAQLQEAFDAAA